MLFLHRRVIVDSVSSQTTNNMNSDLSAVFNVVKRRKSERLIQTESGTRKHGASCARSTTLQACERWFFMLHGEQWRDILRMPR